MQVNLYWDCEFSGLHKNTTLMSIGIVSDLGPTFYAELNDYDKDQIDEWLEENVISNFKYNAPLMNPEDDYFVEYDIPSRERDFDKEHFIIIQPRMMGKTISQMRACALYQFDQVKYSTSMRVNMARLKTELTRWLNTFNMFEVKMVSDCLAYDWVLFNDIFGHAFNIPSFVNYIPKDICTMFEDRNIDPDISREEFISDIGGDVEPLKGDKHNALYDAEVIKLCYTKLKTIKLKG